MSEFQEIPVIQEPQEEVDLWQLYAVTVKCLKTTRILNNLIFTSEDAARRYCRWHKANHKNQVAIYQLANVYEEFCESTSSDHVLYANL